MMMTADESQNVEARPPAKRSGIVWKALIVCFTTLACVRIVIGLFTAPPGSKESYLYATFAGGLVGILLGVVLIAPFYISSKRRIAKLAEADPESVIVRLAGLAEDTNGALTRLKFPAFERPSLVFVSLGISRSGVTVLRNFGRQAAFLPRSSVVNLRMEEVVIATGPQYPVYSFFVEHEDNAGEVVKLSFPMFNDKRFLLGRVPEKRRREKFEEMVAILGISPS